MSGTDERADAIALIAAERERQVSDEGWTPEHDDRHDDRSLITAAVCYVAPDDPIVHNEAGQSYVVPRSWPWEPSAWKPSYRLRDLVKAGALIAAEIDRLMREEGDDE